MNEIVVKEKKSKNVLPYLVVLLVIVFLGFFVFTPISKFELGEVLSFATRFNQTEAHESTESAELAANPEPEVSVFGDKLDPLYDIPSTLYTENKKINVNLVEVSVESDGRMATPKVWTEGGWYNKSSKPGQIGNIIINGHYDNNYGAPAAFWELKNVKENDNVYLVDKLGKVHTYKVVKTFYVDIQDPNRLEIFDEPKDKSELTLITCGGVWLPGQGYSKRLVVKAEFSESEETAFVPTDK